MVSDRKTVVMIPEENRFVHFIDLLMMGNVLPETCRD